MATEEAAVDYSLSNPDTLTKYRTAAGIAQKVLQTVSGWCVEGAKIIDLCQRGDKLLEDEIAKVYKGKKISKGIATPCTISPSTFITPYTPLVSDAEEAGTTLKDGEAVKIQLGAQIDGFGSIVCDTVLARPTSDSDGTVTGRDADLLLATHYANELILRMMLPPGLLATGSDEEKKKAQAQKPYSQSKITQVLEKLGKAYDCKLVENTTCWLFDRNEIESKKKIILAPGDGVKGEGLAEVGEVWGVEIGLTVGNGKVKTLPNRATLHRRTATNYGLKRPSSRATLSEIQKKFGTFPFSLRQLDDERAGKVGIVECVRGGVVRQYEVVASGDGEPVSRLFTTIAITKNGLQRLAGPPTPDLTKWKSDKKITDEEILKILEIPLAKPASSKPKNKKKKKKPAKKAPAKAAEEEESDEDSDEDSDDEQPRRRSEGHCIALVAHAGTRTNATTLGTRNPRGRSTSQDPDVKTGASAVTPAKEKTKGKVTMSGWTEPALSEKPSYRDNHGSGYGVNEYMQPLGEPPNAKVKARVKPDGGRKSLLSKNAAGLSAQDTPEGTPAPSAHNSNTPQPPIVIDDDRDGDYAPQANGKRKERASRATAVSRRSESTPAGGGAAAAKIKTKRQKPYKAPAPAKPHERIVNENKMYDATKLKQVVEAAKKRAHEVGKPDLAAAVNEIYYKSLYDWNLTQLLECILTQTASKSQTADFQSYVRAAKRKLKLEKEAKESARKQPESASTNGLQSLPLRSPAKSTGEEGESSALPSTEVTDSKPSSKTIAKAASALKSPSRKRSSQGHKMTQSPVKKRSGSVGSDSSLTDMTSNADDTEIDEIDRTGAAALARTNGVAAKDHAAERGSLAAPARGVKRSSADAEVRDDDLRELAAKKQKLSEKVIRDDTFEESSMRATPTRQSTLRAQQVRSRNLPPSLTLAPPTGPNVSTRGSRAVSMDLDSPLSSAASSTRSTPQVVKAPKPFGKRAKTKQSPEKKHQTGYGGMPSAGGAGRESPIGDDDNEELSENNDFCSACGGSGFLLCCDGCDRSFHFSCLDPPLNEDASELNEPWFCFICVAKRPVTSDPTDKTTRGLFAPLLSSLRKRNPSNFQLPQTIKDYFEGVASDKNGSFIESVNTRMRNRAGYDELPDFTKVKDGKGNTVLCYHCGKSSQGSRPIIQCDFCSENWHLDCLDPPLANPPARGLDGKKIHDWMCPLHADHELRRMDSSLLAAARSGRKVHIRRPRNAKVTETALQRGFRNNGVIDVLDDDSDSDSEFFEEDDQNQSMVYKLPASGIKLDFIDKVKNTRVQAMRNAHAEKRARIIAQTPRQLEQANFARRSFAEQQLALNLAQFASANKAMGLGSDQVENLVGTLIAEAPPDVVEQITANENAESARSATSAVPPSPPPSEQTEPLSAEARRELLMLQALINRRLEGGKT